MSFSMDVKDEVSKVECSLLEYMSELSCIVRNSAILGDDLLVCVENNSVARRIYKLLKNIYDVVPVVTVRKRFNYSKNLDYILKINRRQGEILRDLSIIDSNSLFLNVPKEIIVGDDDCIRAYLRGLFLSCGSVNDPQTSRYHLEFIVDDKEYSDFVNNLFNNFGLNSRVIRREKNYMVYIKEAEKISDFLRIIKAYSAVMYFENIRIYRDQKNTTNRLNNCEQANIDKIFITASNQIKDIEIIKNSDVFEFLDEKILEVIKYRELYPESSLQELSVIMSKELGYNITKSGLNHRFRKLRDISNKLKNEM